MFSPKDILETNWLVLCKFDQFVEMMETYNVRNKIIIAELKAELQTAKRECEALRDSLKEVL